jgi:hypothetical protein
MARSLKPWCDMVHLVEGGCCLHIIEELLWDTNWKAFKRRLGKWWETSGSYTFGFFVLHVWLHGKWWENFCAHRRILLLGLRVLKLGQIWDQSFYKMKDIHVEQWQLIGIFFKSQIWQPASSTPLLTPQVAHKIVSRVCSASRVSLCYFWKPH